MQYKKKQFVQF